MKEAGEGAYLRYKKSLRTDGATPNILSFLGEGRKWRRRNGRAVERNRGLKGMIISEQIWCVAGGSNDSGTRKGRPAKNR